MTDSIRAVALRLLAAASLLALIAPVAPAQGMLVSPVDGEATLDALLPDPLVRVQLRAGNRGAGGDHELALIADSQGKPVTGHYKWTSGQFVPFRVTWDGLRTVTLDVGGTVLSRDVQGSFSCLAVRAASQHRGASVTTLGLDVNRFALGLAPQARSYDGSEVVHSVLVQGGDLQSGFVLRGKVRLSWIKPPPKGDQVQLEVLLGEPTELGYDYCDVNANSTGEACDLSWSGVPSISGSSLWLHATGGVPAAPCLVLTSPAAQSLPYGNGWLCVGPPVERLEDFTAFDAFGAMSLLVSMAQEPLSTVAAGEVRYFQLWYRDAAGFPGMYNLSDAVGLLFVP